MKNYIKPTIEIEKFLANEYIASCSYLFNCNLTSSDYYVVVFDKDNNDICHTEHIIDECGGGDVCKIPLDTVAGKFLLYGHNETHLIPIGDISSVTSENFFAIPISPEGYFFDRDAFSILAYYESGTYHVSTNIDEISDMSVNSSQ